MPTMYDASTGRFAYVSNYEIFRRKLPSSFFANYREGMHKVIINYTYNNRALRFYCIDMPISEMQTSLFWRKSSVNPILFATKKLLTLRAGWEDEIWIYIMRKDIVDEFPIVITTPSRMLPAVKYGMYTPPNIVIQSRLKGYDEQMFNAENMKAVRSERATVHRILVSAIQEIEQQNI